VRFSVDTNILVYAAVGQTGAKHRTALSIMRRASNRDCVITLQALGELFRVLTGKMKVRVEEATAEVHRWRTAMPVVAADEVCLVDAMDAVSGHGLAFRDSMLWATAKRAGCRLLLSEDGADGRMLGGVTLVNPFISPRSPLLLEALGSAERRR
jgi:predicted nucleic acid-binding protein